MPRNFIPKLIDLYQSGFFPYNRLLKSYKFSAINRTMDDARRGRTIKPVLRMSER